MNSKLIKASLAGAAALAVAAGGTTFASWSDFQVDPNNQVGADVLSLNVNEDATQRFDNVQLYPNGDVRDIAFYVASRDGDAVPDANLTMTIKNLVGTENGCDSNSEASMETGGVITDKTNPAADCNQLAGNEGQFAEQTLYYVQAKKVADPATCSASSLDTRLSNTKLSDAEDVVVNLLAAGDTLAAGEGVCVEAHVFMPNNVPQYGFAADDRSQGDQASFDVRFDLTQVV